MNIIKVLCLFFVSCFLFSSKNAISFEIQQKKIKNAEFKEPIYRHGIQDNIFRDQFVLELFADGDNFPFSSNEQGSVFYKVFEQLFDKEHIGIKLNYFTKGYENGFKEFETGENDIDGIFATYFEDSKYSKNKFIYPSFAENKIHIITSVGKSINAPTKNDLKTYKGVYAKDDFIPNFVLKDLSKLGVVEKNNYSEAFEALLTGKADYVVASFYKSQIFLYKQGLRNYVKYSIDAVWKVPLFFKLNPKKTSTSRLNELKKYIKSAEYKQIRDEALSEVLRIYEENTKGIVPPTYVKSVEN